MTRLCQAYVGHRLSRYHNTLVDEVKTANAIHLSKFDSFPLAEPIRRRSLRPINGKASSIHNSTKLLAPRYTLHDGSAGGGGGEARNSIFP